MYEVLAFQGDCTRRFEHRHHTDECVCWEEFDVEIAGFVFSSYASNLSSRRGFYTSFDDHLQIEVTKFEDVYSFASICFAILTGKPHHYYSQHTGAD